MKTTLILVLSIISALAVSKISSTNYRMKVTIGALLDSNENINAFRQAVRSAPNEVVFDNVTIEFEGIGRVRKIVQRSSS